MAALPTLHMLRNAARADNGHSLQVLGHIAGHEKRTFNGEPRQDELAQQTLRTPTD